MDAMEEIEEVFEIIFPQPARMTVMDRLNPLEWFSEDEFRTRFRLSKDTVSDLVRTMEPQLIHHSKRNKALPPSFSVVVPWEFLLGCI